MANPSPFGQTHLFDQRMNTSGLCWHEGHEFAICAVDTERRHTRLDLRLTSAQIVNLDACMTVQDSLMLAQPA